MSWHRWRCAVQEQLTGSPFGNAEFNQSIKRAVPEGHTFKVCWGRLGCARGCGMGKERGRGVEPTAADAYELVSGCAVCQGYPICFSHMSPALMMTALRQAHVAVDIMKVRHTPWHRSLTSMYGSTRAGLTAIRHVSTPPFQTRGDGVKFAVRAKAYPYPEDTVAVWVMLAVTYRPTQTAGRRRPQ